MGERRLRDLSRSILRLGEDGKDTIVCIGAIAIGVIFWGSFVFMSVGYFFQQ